MAEQDSQEGSRRPETAVVLDQIAALTATAQTNWLALLAGMAYCWVVIASQSDVEILLNDASLDLPLLGTAINPVGFFFAAALVITVATVYLHLTIVRVWSLYAELPDRLDGLARGDRVTPWIAVAMLRDAETLGPFVWIARLAAICTLWIAPVVTIAALGGRYIETSLGLLLWHAGLLVIGLVISFVSLLFVRRSLADIRGGPGAWTAYDGGFAVMAGVFLFAALVMGSWGNQSRDLDFNSFLNPSVDFSRYNSLTRKSVGSSPDWISYETAKKQAIPNACIESDSIGMRSPECYEAFSKLDSARGDWRRASYVGANFAGYRFGSSSFEDAIFEGAALRGINLISSDLSGAQFQHTNLEDAVLRDTDLQWASFEAAQLGSADLSGTNLYGTDFDRAVFAKFFGTSSPLNLDAAVLVRTKIANPAHKPTTMRGALLIGSYLREDYILPDDALFRMADAGWRSDLLPFDGQYLKSVQNYPLPDLDGAALRFLDMRAHKALDLSNTFGDATVALDESVMRPCHWVGYFATDIEFFGRWRGWTEARGGNWPPSKAIGDIWFERKTSYDLYDPSKIVWNIFDWNVSGLFTSPPVRMLVRQVPAIPPPSGCVIAHSRDD